MAIAGAAWGAWWYFLSPRVITLSIFPDYAFRQRPNWKAILESRTAEVERIYAQQTAVRWKLLSIESDDPINGYSGSMDARRTELARNTKYPADVLLIVTGMHEGARTGAVNPFSHAGLVVDFADRSDQRNAVTMAHEMAHFFAAPHEPGELTLMAPEPSDARFSARDVTLIRRLRRYDFKQGTGALQGSWDGRVLDALTQTNAGLHPNPLSQAHQVMGAALAIDGRYAPAIQHLQAALKLDPSPIVRMQLALTLIQDTQADAAVAVLEDGVRSNPNDARLHATLASALARRDFERAVSELDTSIRLEPKNPLFYEALGALLINGMGRIDGAIAAFQTALRLNPGMPRTVQGLAKAQELKENAQAEVVRRSQMANAGKPDARLDYALGLAQMRAGDLNAATRTFVKTIELNPKSGTAYSSLALAHYLRGDYHAALVAVNKCTDLGTPVPKEFLAAIQSKIK